MTANAAELGQSLEAPPGVDPEEPSAEESREESENGPLRFRSTGDGYSYVTDQRPESGSERPVYLHRLAAVAWEIIDGLDDPRHVHHVESVPWLNTESNLEAREPEQHALIHIGGQR